jgi:glutathionylspermidine synthase
MIEQTIINALRADTTLAGYVSSYSAAPAIFANEAPENSELPYITVRITRNALADDSVFHDFNIYVDYWDYNKSRSNANKAAERVEFVLDQKTYNADTRYSTIRTWFFSGGWVEDTDPRDIHYNVQFSARATRKKWIQQL